MDAFGLDGIVVAETEMSYVDGAGGDLIIAGRSLAELTRNASLIEVAEALWRVPVGAASFGAARQDAHQRLASLGGALDHPSPMAALQASIGQLPNDAPPELISAALAVYAAAWYRRHRGEDIERPDPSADHAGDFLRLATGSIEPARARALDQYLVTVADHGLNASTFAARVVTSTGASAVAAVGAAIGALSGPLHGGAPGPVLDMLDAAGEEPRAWLAAELAAGRRIMGMGHRVYRARDPRAAVLERAAAELAAAGIATRLEPARRLEACARELLLARYPDRALCANVELYTAVLLDAIGFDRALFSAIFAVGRVVGWLGHVREQVAAGRLIRPASRYVGPMPGTSSGSR